jgi:hypothetical protein
MAKPKAPDPTKLVSLHINLPANLVAALDARAAELAASDTWPKPTRTDVIRNMLVEQAKNWVTKPA